MSSRVAIRWRNINVFAAVLSVLTASALAASLPGEPPLQPDASPTQSLEAEHDSVPAGFDDREQSIKASLVANTSNSWAGHYYEGDGLGANIRLSLAPDAGAVATWSGCLGLYEANHGSLQQNADGLIRMNYVAPNDPSGIGFPSELLAVTWGERQYMIAPDRLPAFATAINHGYEPRNQSYGMFLLREGDEKKPIGGVDTLPEQVRGLVRTQPVEVSIETVELRERTEKDGFCTNHYVVRVKPLSTATPPLFVGEELDPLKGHETATVLALLGESAEAEIRIYECDDASAPILGARFTTGAIAAQESAHL